MPRQELVKKLDPLGQLTVPQVHAKLEPCVRDYQHLIIQDKVTAGMDIKVALKIYKPFHKLSSQKT